jgi:beta-N-acetylhexosaminidase
MTADASTPTAAGSAAGGVLLPGFAGTELPPWLARRLRAGLAGVCLFGSNIASPRQLRALTDSIVACNPHAVIAVDEEGGDVTRLWYDVGAPTPGNGWLGRRDDLAVTERSAAAIASALGVVGVNLNLAPSVDVNTDDRNPVIGVRSFGADSRRVAAHGAAWVRGHQAAGVAACAKHFPGHGDTSVDSHVGLPVVTLGLDELRTRELLPFLAAVEAGVRAVMTSHILLPKVDPSGPATFSSRLLRDVLRDELGFAGVVVSDALDMAGASADVGIPGAAVRAVAGGCDLLCLGPDTTDGDVAMVEEALHARSATDAVFAGWLADAGGRVAELGADLAGRRRTTGRLPDRFDGLDEVAGSVGVTEVTSSFDVTDRAVGLLTRAAAPWTWVVLDSAPNNAVGVVPWGPAAALPGDDPDLVVFSGRHDPAQTVGRLDPARPVAVVGRDVHRHTWTRRFVDLLRAERSDVLVVEAGWPSADRAYSDVATYGGSRLLGRAVLDLLQDSGRREVRR